MGVDYFLVGKEKFVIDGGVGWQTLNLESGKLIVFFGVPDL